MARRGAKACYGVARGRRTGVFTTWQETERHVSGFPKAVFQGFHCREAAARWVSEHRAADAQADAEPWEGGQQAAERQPAQRRTRKRDDISDTPASPGEDDLESQTLYRGATPSFPKRRRYDDAPPPEPLRLECDAPQAVPLRRAAPRVTDAPKPAEPDAKRAGSRTARVAQAVGEREPQYTLHFDGAAKGNPGVGGAGAWLADSNGNEVWALRHRMERTTCNEAEYTAVVLGLERCVEEKRGRVAVYGDSKLVIEQLSGRWKVNARNLIPLSKRGRTAAKAVSASLHHVPREKNSRADTLANEAVWQRKAPRQTEPGTQPPRQTGKRSLSSATASPQERKRRTLASSGPRGSAGT